MKDKKKLLDLLVKNKYVLLVIAAGVFLILLPVGGGEKVKTPEYNDTAAESAEFSLEEQEKRISDALSSIDGAGRVTVVLTLKSSSERVLATDRRGVSKSARGETGDTSAENSETVVVITAGSQTQSPVTMKYIYPEYKGALIVAQGADNASVRLDIIKAVAGLTGLGTDKITVTKMKNS